MKKNIIAVLSFLVVFFGVKYGIGYYKEYSAVNKAKDEITAIREDVRKNNPDEPEVLAVQKAAIKKAEESINAKGSQKEKRQTAAGTFMGFYLVNYRQRTEYCEKQGVDISPFSNAFKEAHKNEYAIAKKAISASASDIDKLYETLKQQLVTVIKQDMEYIAKQKGVSVPEACKFLSDSATDLIPDMHISVMQPAVHNALMAGQ